MNNKNINTQVNNRDNDEIHQNEPQQAEENSATQLIHSPLELLSVDLQEDCFFKGYN